MAVLEWGSLNLTYIVNKRVTVRLFNSPILLYDGTVVSFRSSKKYYEIVVEGVAKDIDDIEAILSECDEENTLTIANVAYPHAFLVDFNYNYWKTDEHGTPWYKYSMKFVAR